MPDPERKASSHFRKIRKVFFSLVQIVVFSVIINWILTHTAKPSVEKAPAGFFHGMLHGALMPCALPNLVAGVDVPIYAEKNTGLSYKLGYTMGVNACGLLFFGFLFVQIQQWLSKKNVPEKVQE